MNASLGTTEHGDVVTLESWHNEDKMESLHVDGYPDDDLVPLNKNHKNMTDQFKNENESLLDNQNTSICNDFLSVSEEHNEDGKLL